MMAPLYLFVYLCIILVSIQTVQLAVLMIFSRPQ